jgi:hypothetical protein
VAALTTTNERGDVVPRRLFTPDRVRRFVVFLSVYMAATIVIVSVVLAILPGPLWPPSSSTIRWHLTTWLGFHLGGGAALALACFAGHGRDGH